MSIRMVALAAASLVCGPSVAQAQLTISNKPTKNVSCSGGTCSATAARANLNVSDLVSMLSSADVSVASGSQAQNIVLAQPLSWTSAHKLALNSSHNITINAPLIVEGTSSLTLAYGNDGVSKIAFSGKGRIAFWDLHSAYVIEGIAFTLVDSIAALAQKAQIKGDYALANDYDAAKDGVYGSAPIAHDFSSFFFGNGNTISNLTIRAKKSNATLGLFEFVDGSITNLHLTKVAVKGKSASIVGGLAGYMYGYVDAVTVSGKISAGPDSIVGGLVGAVDNGGFAYVLNSSTSGQVSGTGTDSSGASLVGGLAGRLNAVIDFSFSSATVTGGIGWRAGGLVGENPAGSVSMSFATGTVKVADNGFAGGLIGDSGFFGGNNTYATGFVIGGVGSTVGGLIGHNQGPIQNSYSSGPVASGSGNAVGGFIGNDSGPTDLTNTYWDITTSGQSHGVGNDTSYPGITGLTTEEFQAGLPSGFDSAVWAEDANINGGLPYLLAVPPK